MSKTTDLTKLQRYWLEHIQACEKSALTSKGYAEEHGLNVDSLYNARHQLKKKGLWSSGDADSPAPKDEGAPRPGPKFQRVVVTNRDRDRDRDREQDKHEVSPCHSPLVSKRSATPCRLYLPNGVMLEVMTGADAVALATVVEAARVWT